MEEGDVEEVRGIPEETSTQIEHPWEKYQKMLVEEKRKYYKCGDRYVQIKDIKTWPKFYEDNENYFVSRIQKNTKIEPDYPVDARLNGKISLWEGDITTLEIDAIVNAANSRLLGGGGVDGCIHRAAGNTLYDECRLLNGCETGNAKITSGHKLPAKWVIHTVGPIGEDEEALTSCYENCLKVAYENEVRTLAFCCVSTGIYGYPNKDAAEVALKTTREWLKDEDNANAVDRIIFCLFLDIDIKIYQSLMLEYFPLKSEEKMEKTQESPATGINETKPAKTEHEKKDNAKKRGEGERTSKPEGKKDKEKEVREWQKKRKVKDNENSEAETPNSKKPKQESVNADNGKEGRQDEEVVREEDQEKHNKNTEKKGVEKMQQDKIMQEQDENLVGKNIKKNEEMGIKEK